ENGDPGENGGGNGGSGNGGGNSGGNGGGGEEPATIGGSGGGGDDTCELGDASVDCGGTNPDSAGSQPVQDSKPEKPQEELADTGAAETTFLLVGAATMIAGGVGFRFLPRLLGRNGGAAA
ncbi:LPXTG cell wall anchor domain-containing protein, partial [Streptomyces xiaopingdaonensis]|uniref:LPXTG cell wall anchor domain-containing protein n=1 Tax=Streptomyces xiaopingdaonensis TaxID=1565415 RepID=UPI00037903B5